MPSSKNKRTSVHEARGMGRTDFQPAAPGILPGTPGVEEAPLSEWSRASARERAAKNCGTFSVAATPSSQEVRATPRREAPATRRRRHLLRRERRSYQTDHVPRLAWNC